MIYLFENPNNGASVVYDGSTLTDEQKQSAVIVTSLPEPVSVAGKVPVLKVSKETGAVWYDYVTTEESLAAKNAKDIALLQAAIDELILGGEL